ncbi:MAG: hypothetical protein AB4426_21185 [Xenococcaceae cyanobacterium]
MDANRLNYYLKLIQELLSCPSRREVNDILRDNWDLVEVDLLPIMQQEAAKLHQESDTSKAEFLSKIVSQLAEFLGISEETIQGDENAAAWSRNVPAQLATGLGDAATTTSQGYLTFLQEVLQAAYENYGVLQATYPILQRHQDKLDDTFATILQQWARSYFSQANPEEVQSLAGLIEHLCIDICVSSCY